MSKFILGFSLALVMVYYGIITQAGLRSMTNGMSEEWNKHVELARKFNEMKENR
jgi:hypothetical protein